MYLLATGIESTVSIKPRRKVVLTANLVKKLGCLGIRPIFPFAPNSNFLFDLEQAREIPRPDSHQWRL